MWIPDPVLICLVDGDLRSRAHSPQPPVTGCTAAPAIAWTGRRISSDAGFGAGWSRRSMPERHAFPGDNVPSLSLPLLPRCTARCALSPAPSPFFLPRVSMPSTPSVAVHKMSSAAVRRGCGRLVAKYFSPEPSGRFAESACSNGLGSFLSTSCPMRHARMYSPNRSAPVSPLSSIEVPCVWA
jgi:hypothetical protein